MDVFLTAGQEAARRARERDEDGTTEALAAAERTQKEAEIPEAGVTGSPLGTPGLWARSALLQQQQAAGAGSSSSSPSMEGSTGDEEEEEEEEEGGVYVSSSGPPAAFRSRVPLELIRLAGPQAVLHGGPVPGLQVLHRCHQVPAAAQLLLPGKRGRRRRAAPTDPSSSSSSEESALLFVGRHGSLARFCPGACFLIRPWTSGGDLQRVVKPLREGALGRDQLRVFLGESGWHPGQLEREVEQGTWVVARAPLQALGLWADRGPAGQEALWEGLMRGLGGVYDKMASIPPPPPEE